MKMVMNAMVYTASGRIGNLVFESVNNLLDFRGFQAVVVRQMGDHTNYKQLSINVRKAMKVYGDIWTNTVSAAEKTTWDDQADIEQASGYAVRSGYQLFSGFCAALYSAQMGSAVFVSSLGNGATTWEFTDRLSWVYAG